MHRKARYHDAWNSTSYLKLLWKSTLIAKKSSVPSCSRSDADLILLWNLQNTIELRTTGAEIAAPKPGLDAKTENDDFEALLKRQFKMKIINAKY